VAKQGEFVGPVVRTATSFDDDMGSRQLLEEGDQLRAAEIGPQHRPVLLIDTV
jgi:hypothetical protein